MSTSHEKTTRAILLRAINYGDADRVVTVLTEDFGKCSLFAAGARKSSKRFTGALEPFRVIQVRFRDSRGDGLARLMGANVLEAFDQIAHELHTLYWASMTTEWTAELSVEDQRPPVFESKLKLLAWLNGQKRGAWFTEVGCLRFAMVLLAYAGFLPSLDRSARSGTPREDIDVPVFSYSAGGLLAAEEVRADEQAIPIDKATVEFLTEVAQGTFPTNRDLDVLREARTVVLGLFHTTLEREPKSLPLVRSVWL